MKLSNFGYIKLTLASGFSKSINIRAIARYEENPLEKDFFGNENETTLYYLDGYYIQVRETIQYIDNMLNKLINLK